MSQFCLALLNFHEDGFTDCVYVYERANKKKINVTFEA